MSTGPKSIPLRHHRLTHGIYAQHWTREETTIARAIKLGQVDDEIRLTRIRLRRALAAEHAANAQPELDQVIERKLIGEEGSKEDRTFKVRDYVRIIDALTARIESLEKTRRELLKTADVDPDENEKAPIGRIIVEVVGAKSSHDHDRAAG